MNNRISAKYMFAIVLCALMGCTNSPVVHVNGNSKSSAVSSLSLSSSVASMQTVDTKKETAFAIIAKVDVSAYRPSPESFQYIVQKINIDTKEIETLGQINANLFHRPIRMALGKVFYAQQNGELGSFDLQTKTSKTIAMKDITFSGENYLSENSYDDYLSDYLISEKNIVYFLKGICESSCSLHSFDMKTKKNVLLLTTEEFNQKIRPHPLSGISMIRIDEDKGELVLLKGAGDGGGQSAHFFSVNISRKEVKEVNHVIDTPCDIDMEGTEPCSPEEKKHNIEYQRIMLNLEKRQCGKAEFQSDEDRLATYYPNHSSLYYPDNTSLPLGESYYAGCLYL